jgi:uncharacterized protein YjiS (DUF1127 family)
VASVASRSIFTTAGQFVESAGDILLAIASWMLKEILAGCIAYAIAMHGIPAAMLDAESGDPRPSAPPDPPRHPSRSAVHVISANIRSGETFLPPDVAQPCARAEYAARSEPTRGARSGWRTAIIAPAVVLLSKIREGSARRQAIAELQSLDDRSLSDIGISRTDISYIARYGARPE